jgi:hypothetical protein
MDVSAKSATISATQFAIRATGRRATTTRPLHASHSPTTA